MEVPKAEFEAFIKAGRDLLVAIAPLTGEDYKVTDRDINTTIRTAGQVGRAVVAITMSMHVEQLPFPTVPPSFVPPAPAAPAE